MLALRLHSLFQRDTMKGKGARRRSSSGGGGASPGLLDRLLIPRVENYAMNHSLDDIDEVAEALRSSHKEYQRRQMGAFRQMVAKAVKAVKDKATSGGSSGKPELKLQVTVMILPRSAC